MWPFPTPENRPHFGFAVPELRRSTVALPFDARVVRTAQEANREHGAF